MPPTLSLSSVTLLSLVTILTLVHRHYYYYYYPQSTYVQSWLLTRVLLFSNLSLLFATLAILEALKSGLHSILLSCHRDGLLKRAYVLADSACIRLALGNYIPATERGD